MRSILKHYDQWKLDGKYQPLPEPVSETGRNFTPAEEVRLIDTAKSLPEWAVAYHGTMLENETGMRGVEVLGGHPKPAIRGHLKSGQRDS